MSDGNQTLGSDYAFYNSKHRILPIVVGDTLPKDDLKISKLNVNRYSFLNNSFPVEVFVNYNGDQNITSLLRVTQGATTVYSKTLRFFKRQNCLKKSTSIYLLIV